MHLHKGGVPPGAAGFQDKRRRAAAAGIFRTAAEALPARVFEAIEVQRGAAELDGEESGRVKVLRLGDVGVEVHVLCVHGAQPAWQDIALLEVEKGIPVNGRGEGLGRAGDLHLSSADEGDGRKAADGQPARLRATTGIESAMQGGFSGGEFVQGCEILA